LKNIPRENWYSSVLISNNQHLKETKLIKTANFFPNLNFRGQGRIMTELNMPYTKYKLHTIKWDIFHATWFAANYFRNIRNKLLVVTIHDLIYDILYKNEYIPHKDRIIRMGKLSAERADKVIAVSECTKRDMINTWDIDEEKIEVIYHGVDKNRIPVSAKRLIERPYIFFAGGARGKNKNFEHLSAAFSIISNKYKDLLLVCSGTNFTENEIQKLKHINILDKTIQLYASESQMAQLYNDAEMCVVPSYYEGFGFPILEAMVYDCPVLLSNSSCLPEIAGDAGIYFNPYDTEELSHKMSLLLDDNSLRKRQKSLGAQRLNLFSWEKCANNHLNLYKSLI
jgi:glycosyltransferase involved in cell wall biosynthesis